MKRIVKLCWVLFFFMLINGCERRSLIDLSDLNEYAEIEIRVEWLLYDAEKPVDGTIIVYQYLSPEEQTGEYNTRFFRSVIFGESGITSIRLPKGEYAFVVANNKPDEASTFFAKDYESYESAIVRLASVESPAYEEVVNDKFVAQPELLAIDSKSKYAVTDNMITETKSRVKSKSTKSVDVINFYPKQITRRVDVEIHVEGLHNLRSAEVVANGGYRGIFMSSLLTTDVVRSKVFQISEIKFYPNDLYNGVIKGYFTTFGGGSVKGLGEGLKSEGNESTVVFTLYSTLKDKDQTVIATSFDVTDQYNHEGAVNHNIHIKADAIKLPDVEIEGGSGSGFNPDVGEWENGEEQEVPVGK